MFLGTYFHKLVPFSELGDHLVGKIRLASRPPTVVRARVAASMAARSVPASVRVLVLMLGAKS